MKSADKGTHVEWYVNDKEEATEALAYADNEANYYGKPVHVVSSDYKYRYGVAYPNA